jgi:hypothetical protein
LKVWNGIENRNELCDHSGDVFALVVRG